jgi:hypothetical protein
MNSSITYRVCLALGILSLLAFALSASVPANAAASGATITFRKVFKSSYPEFVEIRVSDTGMGVYDIRQLSDDASPQSMAIDAPIVQRIFDLAAKLHNFDGVDLEMHRRIANLGSKTFRYDRGSETHSVTFNYTLDHSAAQLLEVFEDLARQQTALSDLERTMHYDRLGVNDVIQQVEADFDKKLLPEPQQFLAPLDQIAADTHFIDIARDRARALAGRIRSSEH